MMKVEVVCARSVSVVWEYKVTVVETYVTVVLGGRVTVTDVVINVVMRGPPSNEAELPIGVVSFACTSMTEDVTFELFGVGKMLLETTTVVTVETVDESVSDTMTGPDNIEEGTDNPDSVTPAENVGVVAVKVV